MLAQSSGNFVIIILALHWLAVLKNSRIDNLIINNNPQYS